MKHKRKYFILGEFFLFVALLSITIIPAVFKKMQVFGMLDYQYSIIEFFLLLMCGFCFIYSSKYFKFQILSIIFAFLYYFVFLKLYV